MLIHGLGAQLTMWSRDRFCEPLADKGFQVIRYDVRDTGLSEAMTEFGDVDVLDLLARKAAGEDLPAGAYTVRDHSRDLFALLDTLEIDAAHLVGFSMGGVIAQHCALLSPERCQSLTLMATTTHKPDLPQIDPAVATVFMESVEDWYDKEQIIEKALKIASVLGGSKYKAEPDLARERISDNFDRWHNPEANHRLTAALIGEEDRSAALGTLDIPSFVIHGEDDRMVPVGNGVQLADAIPGARLHRVDGMGHMLTDDLAAALIGPVARHLQRADGRHSVKQDGLPAKSRRQDVWP
ncbi:MAG: alpha/beta hydrolase [Pseudomonadota bacterium]